MCEVQNICTQAEAPKKKSICNFAAEKPLPVSASAVKIQRILFKFY